MKLKNQEQKFQLYDEGDSAFPVNTFESEVGNLLRLLGEFDLLPIRAFDPNFSVAIVAEPKRKRLTLAVNWP